MSRRIVRWFPFITLVLVLMAAIIPPTTAAKPSTTAATTDPSPTPNGCKTEPCGDIATDPWNNRLAIVVASNGRFNIGAFPNPETGQAVSGQSWDLSYSWPDAPRTSFTTLRIDGADYVYGTDGIQITAPSDIDARTNRSTWEYGDIQVTQLLQIVPNTQTGRDDVAKISYIVKNTGTTAHVVGSRVMIDSEINYNDGAPFRVPGPGIISTEREFVGANVPATFQTFFGIDDSEHVAASTLRSDTTLAPDRLVFAHWGNLYYGAPYDYTVAPGASFNNDSAYAVYWNPATLGPNEERTYVTWYGLAELEVDLRPPLALGVTGPATLSVVENQYSPNTFNVIATVFNNGAAPATDVQLSLNLPTGLSLANGVATQSIGDLLVGQEQQVSWSIRAAPQHTQTTLTYAVRAVAANADPKTVMRDIALPALQVTTPTPPKYTRSYYIETTNSQENRRLGCTARINGEQGVVVLLFGSPRILRTNSEGDPVYGTRLLANTRQLVSMTQIGSVVRSFARGYVYGCNPESYPRPEPADLTIIVATSNSKVGGNDNPVLTSDHGEAWANLVTNLNRTFQRNYGRSVRAAGGYDAEQEVTDWSSREPTVAWARKYDAVAQYPYYNVGSCDGCPRTEPRSEWTDTPQNPNNRFADIQALDEAFELSWEIRSARSLPQIFYAPYAYQWYNVKRYAREQGHSMFISGALTTCGAAARCDFDDPRAWQDFLPVVEGDFLPPTQAWQALYDTLNAPVTPEQRNDQSLNVPNPLSQRLLPYLTDVANTAAQ